MFKACGSYAPTGPLLGPEAHRCRGQGDGAVDEHRDKGT